MAFKNKKSTEKLMTSEGHYIMLFAKFNKRLQRDFGIMNEIQNLIWAKKNSSKKVELFMPDPYTNRMSLNPKYLSRLKNFNLLKAVTKNCSDERNMLDMTLLKQYTDQVLMHEKLFSMISKYRDHTEDFAFSKLIHSFLVLRPRDVVVHASSENETLLRIDKKLVNMTVNLENRMESVKHSTTTMRSIDRMTNLTT